MSSTEDMAASIVDASNFLRHAANPRTTSPWSIFVLAIISAILLRHAINTYRASGHDKKIGNQNHSLTTIPGPKPLPILGNAFDVDINALVGSVISLAWKFQPLFSLSLLGTRYIIVSTPELCRELCDESKFHKFVAMGLERLRPVTGDGLFTAFHSNEAWGVAHRLLLPLFGAFRIRDMFDDMKDIAEQLTLKWARLPKGERLDPGSDFTRLTLDTVALTCLDFRFNSFYRNESLHPFVQNVDSVLAEAAKRSTLPNFARYLRFRADAKFKKSTEYLFRVCQDMIDQRRRQGETKSRKDVLHALIFGRDPRVESQTGTRGQLSDENIIHNMLTFLSAGHETTSAMLTTICFYLCEYPETQAKAQHEVDRVVGSGPLNVDHIQKLPYLEAVIKEALRLIPTAPTFFVTPHQDGILGGKYEYRKGDVLAPALEVVQQNPDTYGGDAHKFKPERMLREEFAKISEYAFKPFGNGLRGCIGRTFVYQESLIILAMLLQKFDFKKDDPSYKLKLRSDLSVKPDGFYMQITPRQGVTVPNSVQSDNEVARTNLERNSSAKHHVSYKAARGQPIMILHGSNTGTCAAAASILASNSIDKGFAPHFVDTMDSAVGQLSAESPIIMIAASYNGLPAENTTKMMDWLNKMASDPRSLQNIRYAVFGCGHSDWKESYQRIPQLVDQTMLKSGATRLAPTGSSDGATGNAFSDIIQWSEEELFPALYRACNMKAIESEKDEVSSNKLSIAVDHPARVKIRSGYFPAVVTGQQQISKNVRADEHIPTKRHMELRLSETKSSTYETGDHLMVLPRNDPEIVRAVLARFGLAWDTQVIIGSGRALGIDDGTRLTAAELLDSYVEIPKTLTPARLRTLIAVSDKEEVKSQLSTLLAQLPPAAPHANSGEQVNLLSLLQRYPELPFPFSTFLQWAVPMRPRTYSISSAPFTKPGHGTLTISVVPGGVASNYLAELQHGDIIYAKVQPNPVFNVLRMAEHQHVPLIMIAVGSGLAPFRAVVQDLVASKEAEKHSQTKDRGWYNLLFYGCRGRYIDEMYADELDAAERLGVVVVHRAYSREEGNKNGDKYVTDTLTAQKDVVLSLWKDHGALIRVCAGKKVADAIWQILGPVLLGADMENKCGTADHEHSIVSLPGWRTSLGLNSGSKWEGRYVEEVFS